MALWNHDQDEPLMTRRKFFFLAGMAGAFAVAQSTGLVALAERPEVFVGSGLGGYVRTHSGAFELDDLGRILKEIYEPFIAEQIRRDNTLFKLLGGLDAPEIVAREYHVPLARTANTHRGVRRTRSQA